MTADPPGALLPRDPEPLDLADPALADLRGVLLDEFAVTCVTCLMCVRVTGQLAATLVACEHLEATPGCDPLGVAVEVGW